ncbi:hypothetical protein HQ585_18210 [candidate division KSB1 bacterium]|nr:hypothetical protein [candidate division KSB1 bacterium]
MKSRFVILLPTLAALLLFCGRTQEQDADVLLTVGDRAIMVRDFVQRVEMSPLPVGIDINTLEGRRRALDMLVTEKVFAAEAEQLGLHENPVFQKKVRSVESSAVGRELYHEAVRNEVWIHEDEVRDAFQKMNEKLVVRFLQTADQEVAAAWKGMLDDGIPFERLLEEIYGRTDPGDSRVEFTWGQAEPAIEEAAYRMDAGEVSPVIQVSNGYLILKLENRVREMMSTEEHFASRKATIEKMIRRRKEALRSGQFVEAFMKDKRVVLKGRLFILVAEELEKWIDFDEETESRANVKMFVEQEVILTEERVADHLDDALVTFRGGEWTVRQFLEKIWLQEVPINRRSSRAFRRDLQKAIRMMVRDALLAEEGRRRGLAQRPRVRADVAIWRDNFLFILAKNRMMAEGRDPRLAFRESAAEYSAFVDAERLMNIPLTGVPMIAVWTNFQRQLAVPIWPQLGQGRIED